jgi:hypothetical protein
MTQHNGGLLPGRGFEQDYILAGDGIQITYRHISMLDAPPIQELSYQGPDGNRTFTGNILHFQMSELGTLLTVTLQSIQEVTGEVIKLTLLLPDLHLVSGDGTAPIQTLAIRTSSLDPSKGPPYQVYHLQGTVRWISPE